MVSVYKYIVKLFVNQSAYFFGYFSFTTWLSFINCSPFDPKYIPWESRKAKVLMIKSTWSLSGLYSFTLSFLGSIGVWIFN